MTLRPRLDALPASQRALWLELAAIPRGFVLYGGTALALRLGHRVSVDFDFFSHGPLDPAALDRVAWVRHATVLHEAVDTRTVLVESDGAPVKVSWFGSITFGRVGEPETTADGVLQVASALDLAGTKIKVLLQRVEAKDYRDIDALLAAGVALPRILGAARALFGPAFNPLVARKALTYFEGGDLDTLPPALRERLTAAAAHALDAELVPLVAPRID